MSCSYKKHKIQVSFPIPQPGACRVDQSMLQFEQYNRVKPPYLLL
jgi:hypothetical protein